MLRSLLAFISKRSDARPPFCSGASHYSGTKSRGEERRRINELAAKIDDVNILFLHAHDFKQQAPHFHIIKKEFPLKPRPVRRREQ